MVKRFQSDYKTQKKRKRELTDIGSRDIRCPLIFVPHGLSYARFMLVLVHPTFRRKKVQDQSRERSNQQRGYPLHPPGTRHFSRDQPSVILRAGQPCYLSLAFLPQLRLTFVQSVPRAAPSFATTPAPPLGLKRLPPTVSGKRAGTPVVPVRRQQQRRCKSGS